MVMTPSAIRNVTSTGPIPIIRFDDTQITFAHRSNADLWIAAAMLWAAARPRLIMVVSWFARLALALRLPFVEWIFKKTVFGMFCGGTTLENAEPTIEKLRQAHVTTILDFAAEGETSDAGCDISMRHLLEAIDYAARHPHQVSSCALKVTALVPFAILERASRSEPLDAASQAIYDRGIERLDRIVAHAAKHHVAVMIDAEESWIQAAIDREAVRLMRQYNRRERGKPIVLTTVQLYLHERELYLSALLEQAVREDFIAGIKLVRGAYIEKENLRAARLGQTSPVHSSKANTDAAYDRGLKVCLDKLDHAVLCAATHNIPSVELLVAEMQKRGIAADDERITIAQLLGMFDRLTYPLAHHGYRVAKYVPYGPVRDVIPYLLRRADENRSVAQQSTGELALIRKELARRKHTKVH